MSAKTEQAPVLPQETFLRHSTPLFKQLIDTIELINSIDEERHESSNGTSGNDGNGLDTGFHSSLPDMKQRILTKLPVLVWQRKPQIEAVAQEQPEIQTVIKSTDKKSQRRNVSFFQLSNTLQVSYLELRKTLAELGIEYTLDEERKAASAIVNMDDILRLRAYIITQKNDQQETTRDKATPRRSSRGQISMPEGTLSTSELTDRLGISYQSLIRLRLLEGITPFRGSVAKYYSKEDVGKITDKLNKLRKERRSRASITTPEAVVNLPLGVISFNNFLEQLPISDSTLRKLCKQKGVKPIKSGRTPYFDIDQQATLTALVEDMNLSRVRRSSESTSRSPSRETSGIQLLFRRTHGREGDFFRRLPDEGPPAKRSDEAWERYQENLRKRIQERRTRIKEDLIRRMEENPPKQAPEVKIDSLGLGTRFTVVHPKLGETTFTIVPVSQVDAREGKISINSPIVSALNKNGHNIGDKITVSAPQGEYEIELVSLRRNAVKITIEED